MTAPFADGSVFEFWLGTTASTSDVITFANAANGPSCGFTSAVYGEFISIFTTTTNASSQVTQLSIDLVDIRYHRTYSVWYQMISANHSANKSKVVPFSVILKNGCILDHMTLPTNPTDLGTYAVG